MLAYVPGRPKKDYSLPRSFIAWTRLMIPIHKPPALVVTACRQRKAEFIQARQIESVGYWTMADRLATMEASRDTLFPDWDIEGFSSLFAYANAPEESGGLDAQFSSYDSFRKCARNGAFLQCCKSWAIEEAEVWKLGRSKPDLLRPHVNAENARSVIQWAAGITVSSVVTELSIRKDNGKAVLDPQAPIDLDPTLEPDPIGKGPHSPPVAFPMHPERPPSTVVCPHCGKEIEV